jgi:hypothetical protein
MVFRVVKQLMPAPTSSVDRHGNSFDDPWWASRDIYVAKLSGSSDQLWQFSAEDDAIAKMNELAGSDSTGRKYKVIEV